LLVGHLLRRLHRDAGRQRRRLKLALGAARHLLRSEIVTELLDDLRARRHLRERLRPSVKAAKLLKQPALGVGRRLVVRAAAEAEAIERDRGRKHPPLLGREITLVRLNGL
jgi:hypothetical protein